MRMSMKRICLLFFALTLLTPLHAEAARGISVRPGGNDRGRGMIGVASQYST